MQYRKRFEPPVLPMGHFRCEKVHLDPIVYSGMQCNNNNKSIFERYWFAFVEVKASVLLFMMYTDLLKNLAIKEDGLLLSVKGLIWTDDSRE